MKYRLWSSLIYIFFCLPGLQKPAVTCQWRRPQTSLPNVRLIHAAKRGQTTSQVQMLGGCEENCCCCCSCYINTTYLLLTCDPYTKLITKREHKWQRKCLSSAKWQECAKETVPVQRQKATPASPLSFTTLPSWHSGMIQLPRCQMWWQNTAHGVRTLFIKERSETSLQIVYFAFHKSPDQGKYTQTILMMRLRELSAR